MALGAHRIPPGKAWQDPAVVFAPSVLRLMERVTEEPHPDYVGLLSGHGASRPGRVELSARGRIFVGERRYPKGSPSPEPETFMTTAELAQKFRANSEGILAHECVEAILEALQGLEKVGDIRGLMRLL
ncbi:hypothetical protein GCM10023144_18190 [Pigmentiphaga soli]|uniref:MmgE/PrpD C-terminal domain-containing protein n=1 Tax=Pigmentiphaga soli TaxID=1007095 RepID=A0ABP8GV99_9BURK